MKELRVPYSVWKAVLGTLTVYYITEVVSPASYLLAVIGKYDYLVTSRVTGTDATDFETNYKTAGTSVTHLDEATALGLVADRGPLAEVPDSGPTSLRPVTTIVGTLYWDATLSIPIWWSGTAWLDASGTPVDV